MEGIYEYMKRIQTVGAAARYGVVCAKSIRHKRSFYHILSEVYNWNLSYTLPNFQLTYLTHTLTNVSAIIGTVRGQLVLGWSIV